MRAASRISTRRWQLGAMAARHAIPAICPYRNFAAAGGLMSYGTNTANQFRQVGVYTSRLLKSEKPAGLPVQQAVRTRPTGTSAIWPLSGGKADISQRIANAI